METIQAAIFNAYTWYYIAFFGDKKECDIYRKKYRKTKKKINSYIDACDFLKSIGFKQDTQFFFYKTL